MKRAFILHDSYTHHPWRKIPPTESHSCHRLVNPSKRSADKDDADDAGKEEDSPPPPPKVQKKVKISAPKKAKVPKASKVSKKSAAVAPKYRDVFRGTIGELRTMATDAGLTWPKTSDNRTFLIGVITEHYGLQPPAQLAAKGKATANGKGKKADEDVEVDGEEDVDDSDIDDDPEVKLMLEKLEAHKRQKQNEKAEKKRKRLAAIQKEMDKDVVDSATKGGASPESALSAAFGGHSPYQKLANRGATFQIFQHGAFAGAKVTMMGPQDNAAPPPRSIASRSSGGRSSSVGSYDLDTPHGIYMRHGHPLQRRDHYDDRRPRSRY